MKHTILLFISAFCLISNLKAIENHFITNKDYRAIINNDFNNRKTLLKHTTVFNIFNTKMLTTEREAMEFLYAYSPFQDIMQFDGNFWLENVRQTFKAKQEMPWGSKIPEDIFRHYVLPLRGNNEELDSARIIFYKVLLPRVKNCSSMEEAALEVNHWCHEKANYQPTDARTASPQAIIKRTYGRCGEESVFTVAALRSVGLPARQIYTPRWAHCDDNHAWIEVWVDGEWKFLGACEPEPALNIAWFTYPASRGLFMQCKVFGKYYGNEEVIGKEDLITIVNTTTTYTDTKRPIVKVYDNAGKICGGAKIEYKIYNYGEFYTVATLIADVKGEASLTMGLGDWIIWGSNKGHFGFVKANPKDFDTIKVVLNDIADSSFCIVPPPGKDFTMNISLKKSEINDRRIKQEDSIRDHYKASFINDNEIDLLIKSIQLDDKQGEDLRTVLHKSMGNYNEIVNFCKSSPNFIELLNILTTKDLQDIDIKTLLSHLNNWIKHYAIDNKCPDTFTVQYVISPRIHTEKITAWREEVAKWLANHSINDKSSINDIILSMNDIKVYKASSRGDVFLSPDNVAKCSICDVISKNIFFVAACRTLNIPARLNPIDGEAQYFADGEWKKAQLHKNTDSTTNNSGFLSVKFNNGVIDDPLYYVNFTISRIENGCAKLLTLGDASEGDMGPGMKCNKIFEQPVELEQGEYIAITGNRSNDGSVMSEYRKFNIVEGQNTILDLSILPTQENHTVYGKIDLKHAGITLADNIEKCIIIQLSDNEPSIHLMRDLEATKSEIEKRPNVAFYKFHTNNAILKVIDGSLKLRKELPLVFVVDKDGNIYYYSQGYKIGTGYQILKYI